VDCHAVGAGPRPGHGRLYVGADVEAAHAVVAEELNERFGAVNPRAAVKVKDVVHEWAQRFIARSPFMVLATASADGACDASPKGGRPGFVLVLDEKTLLIPDYKGKSLFTPCEP